MDFYLIIIFFGLLSTTIYSYTKILNIQNVKNNTKILAIIFSIIMSIPLSFSPPLYEFMFIGSTFAFMFYFFKDDFSTVLAGLLISIGIVLGFNTMFSTVFFNVFDYVYSKEIVNTDSDFYYSVITFTASIFIGILVFISVRLMFKIKRLRKGFVFLQLKDARWTGIIISIIVMYTRSFLDNIDNYISSYEGSMVLDIYFLLNSISILVIVNIWWRSYTNTVYQLRINQRIIDEQQMEIEKLTASNKFLSETVHRDNKIVPAMHSTLKQYLDIENNNENNERYILLEELDELMKERKEKLSKFNKNNLMFSSTGLSRIDSIISYMHSIALEKNIELIVVSMGNLKEIVEKNYISKSALETLLADLLENTIIATSFSENKKILLTIGMIDNYYEFEIKDSGIPFELKTLNNLGIKKATTHADIGGSGIGYLKIFEILKEANASFILNEEETDKSIYTKSIKIRFDNLHNFIIYSNRTDHIKNPKINKQVYNE